MNLIQEFLSVQQNIRMYHWTTKIYNQHVVSGELYEKLDGLIDKFVETFLGKNKINFDSFDINFKIFLMGEIELFLGEKTNSDLKNIRDEMLSEVNKSIYLLRLQ